jgi:hypothetical protein
MPTWTCLKIDSSPRSPYRRQFTTSGVGRLPRDQSRRYVALPVGLTFTAKRILRRLIQLAYAFEQATRYAARHATCADSLNKYPEEPMPKRSKYPMPPKKAEPSRHNLLSGDARGRREFAQTLIDAAEQVRPATQLRAEGTDGRRVIWRALLVTQCRVLPDETQSFSDRVRRGRHRQAAITSGSVHTKIIPVSAIAHCLPLRYQD